MKTLTTSKISTRCFNLFTTIWIIWILIAFSNRVIGQSCAYILDLKDNNTYTNSCNTGSDQVTPSQWKVSNADCYLVPNLSNLDFTSCNLLSEIPIEVILNRGGTMNPGDYFEIQYRCSPTDSWHVLLHLDHNYMNNYPSVHNIRKNLTNVECSNFTSFAVRLHSMSTRNDNHIMIRDGDFSVNSPLSPLPLDLISFSAKSTNENTVQLNWVSSAEESFSHFEIERSESNRDWQTIDKVESLGNDLLNQENYYQFENKVFKMGTYYYRLKMMDLDGSYTYSDIVSIKMTQLDPVQIYPTKATDFINLESTQDANYAIYDLRGRLLLNGSLIADEKQRINLDPINRGTYIVQFFLEEEQRIASYKFLKLSL